MSCNFCDQQRQRAKQLYEQSKANIKLAIARLTSKDGRAEQQNHSAEYSVDRTDQSEGSDHIESTTDNK